MKDIILLKMDLPRDLTFDGDGWTNDESMSLNKIVEQIGGLKELWHMQLVGYQGCKLPNIRNIFSLCKAIFYNYLKFVMGNNLSLNL
jgi:hypothetical protein